VYRFSSKEIHVNSGLYYYGYRWYAPNLQRWLNRDPINELGFNIARSLSARHDNLTSATPLAAWFSGDEENLFRFCHNNPVVRYDWHGLTDGDFTSGCFYLCGNAGWPIGQQFFCLLLPNYSKKCSSCPSIGWATIDHGGIMTIARTPCPTILCSADPPPTPAIN